MRAKVTIRGIKRPATIEETTMNKAIQDIYEGMRAKLNKTFFRETLNSSYKPNSCLFKYVYLKRTEDIRTFIIFSVSSAVEYKEAMHALPVSGLNNIENCQINDGRVSYFTDCIRIMLPFTTSLCVSRTEKS